MNYIKITTSDVANGLGMRVTLWTAGCRHKCPGCHNPETHSFSAGKPFGDKAKEALFKELEKPYISGLTLSGGDPAEHSEELARLVKEVKEKFPGKNVWMYTGYTLGDLFSDPEKAELAILVDVIVEGRFEISKRNVSLAFRGSSNQKIYKKSSVSSSGAFSAWEDITDKLDAQL